MASASFDPAEYYSAYPNKILARPGYPARAQFKSTLLWRQFGAELTAAHGTIRTYADIGGCFGFGANSMAYQIARAQGQAPSVHVFEISRDFVTLGKQLFPNIEFVAGDFSTWAGEPRAFDLVTMFDLVEHLVEPERFLGLAAQRAKFGLFKTPLETTGDWRRPRPPMLQGAAHPDGHVNFFTPASYEKLLQSAGFTIVSSKVVSSIIPAGAELALDPESTYPSLKECLGSAHALYYEIARRIGARSSAAFALIRRILGGGTHLCLARSRYL
jgi:hypothetical protein